MDHSGNLILLCKSPWAIDSALSVNTNHTLNTLVHIVHSIAIIQSNELRKVYPLSAMPHSRDCKFSQCRTKAQHHQIHSLRWERVQVFLDSSYFTKDLN